MSGWRPCVHGARTRWHEQGVTGFLTTKPAAPNPKVYRWTPPSREARAAELMRAEREARYAELKLYSFAILQCFAATGVGCVIAGFGFAIYDPEMGQILVLSGSIVSLSGNMFALGRLAIRIDRGEV